MKMKKILSMILATIIVLGLITVSAETEPANYPIEFDGVAKSITVDGNVSSTEWGVPTQSWTWATIFSSTIRPVGWELLGYTGDYTMANGKKPWFNQTFNLYAYADDDGVYLAFQLVAAIGRDQQETVTNQAKCAGLDFSIGTYAAASNVKTDDDGNELKYTYRIYETYDATTETFITNQRQYANAPALQKAKVGFDDATSTYTYEVFVPYDNCIEKGADIVLSYTLRDQYLPEYTSANAYNFSNAARYHINVGTSDAPFRDYNPIRLTIPECYAKDTLTPMPAEKPTMDGNVSADEWGSPVIVTSPEHVEKAWGSTGYTKGTNATQNNNQRAKVYMTNDDEYLYIAATLDHASESTNSSANNKFNPVLGVTVSQYANGSVYMAGDNECFRLFRMSKKYDGDIYNWTRIYDTNTTSANGDHQDVNSGDYAAEYDEATATYTFEMKIKWDTIPGMRDDQWKTSPIAMTLRIGDGNLGTTSAHSNSYYQIGGTADVQSTATRTPHASGGFIVMNINNQLDKAAAKIGDMYYESFDTAVKAATSGQTVTLLANAEMEQWTDEVGITLDLDGHILTAKTVSAIMPFSKIIDSQDGQGGIQIAKNSDNAKLLQISANSNEYLPLYDASMNNGDGGYRFFNCTLEHRERWKEENTKYQFGYVLKMSDTAFALLKDSDSDKKLDADIELVYTISLTVDGDDALNETYVFNTGLMTQVASNAAPTLSVTGFEKVGGHTIVLTSSNPKIESSTGVNIVPADEELTLTYPNAQ